MEILQWVMSLDPWQGAAAVGWIAAAVQWLELRRINRQLLTTMMARLEANNAALDRQRGSGAG